jgi:hypothetical protein
MREYKNQSISFSDPLTLTLSRKERDFFDSLLREGERAFATASRCGGC